MDSPRPFEDEVIADSEDEMEQISVPTDRNFGVMGMGYTSLTSSLTQLLGHGANTTSSLSAFTAPGYPRINTFSAISTFTGDAPRLSIQPARIHLPEHGNGNPDIVRNADADTSIGSFNSTFINVEGIPGPGNIADRAKMRQRTQKKPSVDSSDVIELTSDEDELALKPSSSKARSSPKVQPKPKAKPKVKEISSEGATSSKITMSSKPSKPRPLPVPIKKRPKPAPASPSTPGPELPIATSPPHIQLPNQNARYPVDSQLPPSDPPNSTFRTDYSKEHKSAFPRIETLPDIGPSSPSSLFSEVGPTTKKSQRRPMDIDAEVDELATPEGGLKGRYHFEDRISPGRMPPPTFFAGSSSSSMGGGKRNTPPAETVPEHEVVDLTTLPPTLPQNPPQPAPKTKKPKKKKVEIIYDEDERPAVIAFDDKDDQDEDFDPTGDGEKKKKSKAKAKGKEKAVKNNAKSKNTKTSHGANQVEVLITKPPKMKPKAADKSDAKNKGKEKAVVKERDKDAFKSREFIIDSDEDDPMGLIDGPSGAPIPVTPSAATFEEKGPTSSSNKPVVSTGTVPYPIAASPVRDSGMAKPKSSTKKPTSGSNKRKTVIDSDDEEDTPEIPMNISPSISKKRRTDGAEKTKEKTKVKGNGKKRLVLLSDEEEGEPPVMDDEDSEVGLENTVSKKGKLHKKNDQEDSEGAHRQAGSSKHISSPEEVAKSTKENAPPLVMDVSKPGMMATPKPSRPIPLNQDGSTPLYARYEIAPRRSSLPMSELIRRANSMPGSPFPTPHASSSASRLKPLVARTPSSTAYSPYLKSSRSLLSKIAPLHPNRRTPPPPPPPPPPRKKSKKELELEEKWEEEMIEDAGGMEAWAALQDEERKEMRKIKWNREIGGWDD